MEVQEYRTTIATKGLLPILIRVEHTPDQLQVMLLIILQQVLLYGLHAEVTTLHLILPAQQEPAITEFRTTHDHQLQVTTQAIQTEAATPETPIEVATLLAIEQAVVIRAGTAVIAAIVTEHLLQDLHTHLHAHQAPAEVHTHLLLRLAREAHTVIAQVAIQEVVAIVTAALDLALEAVIVQDRAAVEVLVVTVAALVAEVQEAQVVDHVVAVADLQEAEDNT